jgi:hypothetical protein
MQDSLSPRPADVQPQERGPNCWGCVFFGVSHNPATPYACRLMGFQSRAMPSIEVLRADGHPCRGFRAKATACQTSGTTAS